VINTMKKPHVVINCAMSADGKIALPDKKQLKISCEEDFKRTHRLRNECDAVLVGIETILSDDPRLTVKEKYVKKPRHPIRVVLDTNCRTPKNALVLNNESKTIVATTKKCKERFGKNVEVLTVKTDEDGLINLEDLLDILYTRGIKKLMVEGGGTVIWGFLNKKLADDMYVYIGPMIVGGRETPTLADGCGIKNLQDLINLEIVSVEMMKPGILVHYKIKK